MIKILSNPETTEDHKKATQLTTEKLKYTQVKTKHTLLTLMKLLGIESLYPRIELQYQESDQDSAHAICLLLNRCHKLYHAVADVRTIFKLALKRLESSSKDLDRRLFIAIKTFLTEHTLFPLGFRFGDENLIASLS